MAEQADSNGADLDLKVAGQEVHIKNVRSLNTILTLVAAVAACFTVYLLFQHSSDAKEASKELVTALREMTQTAREQNCLISMPQDRRDAELCKRISR